MAKKTKKEKIQSELNWCLEKLEPIIEKEVIKLGYSLLLVEFVNENNSNYLRITISHQDKLVGLEDCEKVSRAVEEKLDKTNIIPCQYILEVQSPGSETNVLEDELKEKKSQYNWDKHEFSLKGLDLVINS